MAAKRREDGVQVSDSMAIGGYDLTCAPMTEVDVPRLHELSVSVSWPHRAEDWAMLLRLGQGVVAKDEIGRVFGSAMWIAHGATRASVGMVITSPRLQENGAGRWLMAHALAQTAGRVRVLNATKAAIRLYLSLGFQPLATNYQHNGLVTAVPAYPPHAAWMTGADVAELRALDAAAMGVAREATLSAVLEVAERGTVIRRGGVLAGFALLRRFGRGRVIGPIVAETDEDAIALCGPLVARHPGGFLRVDTRAPAGPFRDFLQQAGLVEYDTVQWMSLEPLPAPTGPARTYGLISQALG
jgi:GNAT superfamily N-acetyltransferase